MQVAVDECSSELSHEDTPVGGEGEGGGGVVGDKGVARGGLGGDPRRDGEESSGGGKHGQCVER